MERTHAILAAGILGTGAMLLTAPAYAAWEGMPDGFVGTNAHAQNCDCAAAEQTATQKRQVPTEFAKHSNPGKIPINSDAGNQQQR